MNWSKLVRDLRHELLLSQEEMAKKLGVAFSTINRYENGHFNPTPRLQREIKSLAIKNKIDFKSYKDKNYDI